MKKVFLLLFFLSGCMTAPQKSFQLNSDEDVHIIRVAAVEAVPLSPHFDSLPHVEDQMPTTPEEAVVQWVQTRLKPEGTDSKRLHVIVHKAEMLKTDMPSDSFFEPDEENYVLNYELEVQVRIGEKIIQAFPVTGKGFIQVAKKASLASKEKGWSWLIQKMLTHLKTQMQTELENVFVF